MLGVHQNTLDHEILETGNPKTLIFVDSSVYMEEPDRPLLEVLLPGYNKYLLVNYVAKQVNPFNSGTLGLNRTLSNSDLIDLPDGIWQIKQKICPYKYIFIVKKHMRVTNLLLKLASVYEHIDLMDCQSKDDKLLQLDLARIHTLIEGAQLVVNKDSKKAYDNYHLADRMTETLLRKFCKNCK